MEIQVHKATPFDETALRISEYNTSVTLTSFLPELSPFSFTMKFPKRRISLTKRKRQNDDQLYKKIAKLAKEKRALSKSDPTLSQLVTRCKKRNKVKRLIKSWLLKDLFLIF